MCAYVCSFRNVISHQIHTDKQRYTHIRTYVWVIEPLHMCVCMCLCLLTHKSKVKEPIHCVHTTSTYLHINTYSYTNIHTYLRTKHTILQSCKLLHFHTYISHLVISIKYNSLFNHTVLLLASDNVLFFTLKTNKMYRQMFHICCYVCITSYLEWS